MRRVVESPMRRVVESPMRQTVDSPIVCSTWNTQNDGMKVKLNAWIETGADGMGCRMFVRDVSSVIAVTDWKKSVSRAKSELRRRLEEVLGCKVVLCVSGYRRME